MTNPYFAEQLAVIRERDARVQSERARLVALARCCRPSEIAARLTGLRERISALRARHTSACCA